MLLNPIVSKISINSTNISEKPVAFEKEKDLFQIGHRQLFGEDTTRDFRLRLLGQNSFIVPLSKKKGEYDTIKISYSMPEIVKELNRMYEEEYFFISSAQLKKNLFNPTDDELKYHIFRQLSPDICKKLNAVAEKEFKNGYQEDYFYKFYKLNNQYYDAVYLPVFDLKNKFEGFLYSYSIDGYFKFHKVQFIKRLLVVSISLLIMFLLYYLNIKKQNILIKKNIEIQEDQEKLKIAKEKAEEANRTKSEFLANMSHEIRTPINTILGFTDILMNQISDTSQKNYLKSINSGTITLLNLLTDILDLSKIETGKMKIMCEPASLKIIFKEIENVFARKIMEKNLDYFTIIDKSLPDTLLIDETRFRQIIFNIVGNAVKFTDKGYVKLKAKAEQVQGTTGKIDLVVDVEDSGVGIPIEKQEEIFKEFTQQNNKMNKQYGGTGLGLSISRKLAHLMGGEILLKSEVGKGSVFTVILHNIEVLQYDIPKSESTLLNKNDVVFKKSTVLIVDDIPLNRLLIREFLKNNNITIIEASDGKSGIEIIKKTLPDLILMDIRMPVMNGLEATKYLKNDKRFNKIPVVALSASVIENEIIDITNAGFDDILFKPLKFTDFITCLIKFLKYTKKQTKPPVSNDYKVIDEKLSSAQRKKIPELIVLLEGKFMNDWEKVKKGGFIDEIAEFGKNINAIGEKYSINQLKKFGDEIVKYSESFDVNRMNKVLVSYPDLVQAIKNLEG